LDRPRQELKQKDTKVKSSRYFVWVLCAAIAGCAANQEQATADKEPTSAPAASQPASKPATTQTAQKPRPKDRPVDDDTPQKWNQMQYGSLLSATFENRRESGDFTNKGIAITCSLNPQARIIFDTELLRYSAAWTDGYIYYTNVAFDGRHGDMPSPRGNIVWAAKGQQRGVSLDGKFNDPREVPYGTLPREMGHYKGLFRNGRDVILSYTVGDCDILDKPGSEVVRGTVCFRRQLELGWDLQRRRLRSCWLSGRARRIRSLR
jgi:hypothetical protein